MDHTGVQSATVKDRRNRELKSYRHEVCVDRQVGTVFRRVVNAEKQCKTAEAGKTGFTILMRGVMNRLRKTEPALKPKPKNERKNKEMKNDIPKTNPELLTFAGAAAIGAGQYGAAIPLLQNTQTNINTDIQALVDAIMAYGEGRTEFRTRRDSVKAAVRTARVMLMLGRDSLKPQFGNLFNESWLPLGHNGSLEISEDPAQLLNLLRCYQEFLENNPMHELVTKDLTAVHLEALFTDLEAALGALNIQDTIVGNLMETRDRKADKLRRRLRGLIEELYQNIDPLDQRWKAFGLNLPGAQETPDIVENVEAILIGPNAAALKWDNTARAEYYHVFKRVQGIDEDYILVGSPADLDFTLENLPSGKQIDIIVAAVNNGGEGERSVAVTIITA